MIDALANDLNPVMDAQRRLMARWSCSTMLLRYLLRRTSTLIYLDDRHRMFACQEQFRGTIDGASIHPREVVKEPLHYNAAAVILAHNRLSGVAEPGQADELITRRLREALALVDIRVLDHVIVAGADSIGFAERGLP